MSTFGRGLRYELKRVTGNVPNSQTTVLSVPANANYYIFLQFVSLDNANGAFKVAQRITGGDVLWDISSSPWFGSATDSNNMMPPDAIDAHSEFANIGTTTPVSASDVHDAMALRYLMPNQYLQLRSTSSGDYRVYYTEVYFGGQSNY